jgi:hypothetical protein
MILLEVLEKIGRGKKRKDLSRRDYKRVVEQKRKDKKRQEESRDSKRREEGGMGS